MLDLSLSVGGGIFFKGLLKGARGANAARKMARSSRNLERAEDVAQSGRRSGDDLASTCTGGKCDGVCFTAGTPIVGADSVKAIEDVEVGDRVRQFGGRACSEQPFTKNGERCAVVRLEYEDPYGYEDTLVVDLMRSHQWIEANAVELGGTVHLAIDEIGIEGRGRVSALPSCPQIDRGAACLVTGTFTHRNRDVLEVTFAESDLVLQPTVLHPLWSVGRGGWVRAGALEVGERLRTQAGPLEVAGIRRLDGSHQVYNLEVAGDHAYLVRRSGILSHNADGCREYPDDWWDGSTKQRSADYGSEGEARALAREKLGNDPVKINDHKWRSRDGKWQYRAKEADVDGVTSRSI